MNRIDHLKLISLLILLCTLNFSCRSFNRSDRSLTDEKMIEIMFDIQVAKAAVNKYPISERDSISKVYFDQIYEIHKIDKYQFDHDLQSLENDPVHYKKIIDSLSVRIKKLEKILGQKELEEYD